MVAVRLKTDENVPLSVLPLLRADGRDVLSVHDQAMAGAKDPMLLAALRDEGRALLTLDKGFGDLRVYPPFTHAGIIVLRPAVADVEHLTRLLHRVLAVISTEPIVGRLWIVDDEKIRIRGTLPRQ